MLLLSQNSSPFPIHYYLFPHRRQLTIVVILPHCRHPLHSSLLLSSSSLFSPFLIAVLLLVFAFAFFRVVIIPSCHDSLSSLSLLLISSSPSHSFLVVAPRLYFLIVAILCHRHCHRRFLLSLSSLTSSALYFDLAVLVIAFISSAPSFTFAIPSLPSYLHRQHYSELLFHYCLLIIVTNTLHLS